jgi:DNA-binding response OmpR family regulator
MPGPVARKTLLIVDDDRDFREALEAALTQEGFDVVPARTAAVGVELALACNPDAVLLDDRLPDGRGYDALTVLRERGFGRPVVLVSGFADVLDLRHPSATRVLRKPVDYDELVALLRALTTTSEGVPP